MRKKRILLTTLFLLFIASQSFSQEQMIGEVKLFAGNFAPKGWAFCDGSVLPINQNTALFSIIGTTYGGDGRITFALPDLRGKVPVGVGKGSDMEEIRIGHPTSSAAKGEGGAPALGMNYIIALKGTYPSRQ